MNKTTKIILGVVILVIIVVLVAVFYKPSPKEAIKIGVILPLTGQGGKMGQDVRDAADLAKEEINQIDGIKGRKIDFIYEDSPTGPPTTVTAMQKLLDIDKVKVVIGAMDSSSVLAIAPLAEENRILLISPTASTPKLTTAGDYIFRVTLSDVYEGKMMGKIAYQNLGLKEMAILYANNDYGVGFKDILQKTFEELGGKVSIIETYDPLTPTDFRTQLVKIKEKKPQALYIIAILRESGLIVKQVKELGIDCQLLAARTFEDPTILEVSGEAAEGVIFAAYKSITTEEFISKHREKYGRDPGMYSSRAYDSVKLIAKAMIECKKPENTLCIKEELYKVKDYQGASGLITFDENGDILKSLILKTVKNGQFVPYEEQ